MVGRKVLVTGATGFCGQHLVMHLLHLSYDVTGFDCKGSSHTGLETYVGDIADTTTLQSILSEVQPNTVFHLAALTSPRLGYEELHRVNVLGTLSLLEAVHQVCPEASVLVTSSSAVYGCVSEESLPITEDQLFHPTNPYAVSKVAQEMVAYQQFAQHSLRVIRTRAFNITGPGESAKFVTSAFARQIVEIEAGLRDSVIKVGNLDAIRDFVDVRDVVRAYGLILNHGEPGEVYNISSGEGTPIRQLLDGLLNLSQTRGISVEVDSGRLQPADVPIQVGDSTRLRMATGWQPSIPLRQTLKDVLEFWRQHVNREIK